MQHRDPTPHIATIDECHLAWIKCCDPKQNVDRTRGTCFPEESVTSDPMASLDAQGPLVAGILGCWPLVASRAIRVLVIPRVAASHRTPEAVSSSVPDQSSRDRISTPAGPMSEMQAEVRVHVQAFRPSTSHKINSNCICFFLKKHENANGSSHKIERKKSKTKTLKHLKTGKTNTNVEIHISM